MSHSPHDRILDAADELFYQRGFHAVGVDEIVARSGVAKTTLYAHFRSKDRLIAACLQRRSDAARSLFEQEAGNPALLPAEQIDRFFAIVEVSCRDPEFRGCPFINFGVEFPSKTHPARAVCLAHRHWMKTFLSGIAARGGADDAESLGARLCQLYDAAMIGSQLDPAGGDAALARSTARALTTLTFSGIGMLLASCSA
jgi:AcrR family transcriptional regulator